MSSLHDRLKAKYAYVERVAADMHAYQDEGVDFLKKLPFSALFIDTGLGKTVIVLTMLLWLIFGGRCKKILIVAPTRVAAQGWPNEIAAWEHTACLNYSVIRAEDDDVEVVAAWQAAYAEAREWAATDKEARSAAGKAAVLKKEEVRQARRRSPASIHIIDWGHLDWLVNQHSEMRVKKKGQKPRRVVTDWPYDVVILDEATAVKDPSTVRFKALAAVRAQGFVRRLHLLTATPAAEGYMGLFAMIWLLDLGKRLGQFITHYRQLYFDESKYSRAYKLKPGADELISKKIGDIALVMKSKDYLNEEDPLFLTRTITLTPPELAQYRHFQRNFVMELPVVDGEDGEVEVIEAKTAADLAGKLLQLASGAIYGPDGKARVIHDHKIEDLRELKEELQGEPLLVAYWYKSSLERLKKAFPDAVVMDKAGKVAERHGPWNTGKISMLLIHPMSAGEGLNMQYGPGHDLYMFDLCWSFHLFYQLYRRLHRQGQKLRVRIHMPQVRGTRDEMVAARLKNKEDAQEVLFNWIRAIRRKMKEARLAA